MYEGPREDASVVLPKTAEKLLVRAFASVVLSPFCGSVAVELFSKCITQAAIGMGLTTHQFDRDAHNFGIGRLNWGSLTMHRRPRVNQDNLLRFRLAGWRRGLFFVHGGSGRGIPQSSGHCEIQRQAHHQQQSTQARWSAQLALLESEPARFEVGEHRLDIPYKMPLIT